MSFEGIHCYDRGTVRFAIYPDGWEGPRVLTEISEHALRDIFGAQGGGDGLLKACQANFESIEAKAVECHRAQPEKAIVLSNDDFEQHPVSGWLAAA